MGQDWWQVLTWENKSSAEQFVNLCSHGKAGALLSKLSICDAKHLSRQNSIPLGHGFTHTFALTSIFPMFLCIVFFSPCCFLQAEGWSDMVKFLQELCGLARHLQPNGRAELLGQLVNLGLFEVQT